MQVAVISLIFLIMLLITRPGRLQFPKAPSQ
jgi:hypothetical protein